MKILTLRKTLENDPIKGVRKQRFYRHYFNVFSMISECFSRNAAFDALHIRTQILTAKRLPIKVYSGDIQHWRRF